MFESIKLKKRQKELEIIKNEIIKAKNELEAIKQLLEEKCEKIDISNIYVFSYGGIFYLVYINKVDSIYNEVIDIFNNQILFNYFRHDIERRQRINMEYNERYNGEDTYATLVPILEDNPDLLIYVDRQVPEYVLQQYLYKLNNINIANYVKSK